MYALLSGYQSPNDNDYDGDIKLDISLAVSRERNKHDPSSMVLEKAAGLLKFTITNII